jgi:hypothetical protein
MHEERTVEKEIGNFGKLRREDFILRNSRCVLHDINALPCVWKSPPKINIPSTLHTKKTGLLVWQAQLTGIGCGWLESFLAAVLAWGSF